ncbi:unnamed protein product, partial [Owenia fusiformis]
PKMAATDFDHHENVLVKPPRFLQDTAHVSSFEQYQELYDKSVNKPDEFWGEISKNFFWKSPPTGEFLKFNFDVTKGPIFIEWMKGATTNICYNCLDRNVNNGFGDKVAFYW